MISQTRQTCGRERRRRNSAVESGMPVACLQDPDGLRGEMLPEEETLRLFRERAHGGSIV
jgi:hypothetical protein